MINFTRLSPFLRFFVRARGEPGNEATLTLPTRSYALLSHGIGRQYLQQVKLWPQTFDFGSTNK